MVMGIINSIRGLIRVQLAQTEQVQFIRLNLIGVGTQLNPIIGDKLNNLIRSSNDGINKINKQLNNNKHMVTSNTTVVGPVMGYILI